MVQREALRVVLYWVKKSVETVAMMKIVMTATVITTMAIATANTATMTAITDTIMAVIADIIKTIVNTKDSI